MNFFTLITLAVLILSVNCQFQNWNAQQMEAYRQQYYQWYQQQQALQQQQQQAAPAPAAQPQGTPHPVWGHAQSDDKGNFWHGNDHAKIMLVARSSYP
ncbi:unnamed protein product [Caenorhabditis angaria]|uniref:Uncharacterized protein n=1 Tax=Caenorhabditis angaria TaxID=860376 RepID=A0A9P1ICG6_9PELO|nr:unnamed protein product [Caenorhabditis angaria]